MFCALRLLPRRLGPYCSSLALALLAALLPLARCAAQARDEKPRFEIALDRDVAGGPLNGRLYIFLSQRDREPMRGPDWFRPEPFFRLDVTEFKPGETRTIDDRALSFPDVPSKLPAGKYRAQAVLDHDFYEPSPANGVGNLFSEVVEFEIGEPPNQRKVQSPRENEKPNGAAAPQIDRDDRSRVVALRLTNVVKLLPFPDSKWVKEVVINSDLLHQFHKREVIERAAVVLPARYYDEPERKYPAVYIVPGFGGSHRDALRYANEPPKVEAGETAFIRVFLSGRCKWGHHVYADSATNGPRGESLIREMIPHIDREYRTVADPTARFVMGHSSGGWSSLWLQVTYPQTFGGVWSSSPDAVDFRDFQQVNLYSDPPENMYRDQQSGRRPIARGGDKPVLWFDAFTKMDDVIGRGGQLRSFEAVFSPLDDHRLPKFAWDRKTGQVDPTVTKAWEKYDISLILKRDWPRLSPLLAGKLHITMGALDTFYLDGATKLLAERLKELGSDADITFIEGANHGSFLTAAYFARVRREMSEAYWKAHGKSPQDQK